MSSHRPSSRRVSAAKTGAATGGPGSVVVTGVLMGDVYQHTDAPPRSRYHAQVEVIAGPDAPLDRDGELADLAEFCTSEQAATYQ